MSILLKNKPYLILLLTLLALLPQYLIRCNLTVCWWFYEKLTTYYGDLWYCWNNYLSHGFPYPREYPSLIQQVFKLIALIPGIQQSYSYYLIFPVAILAACALLSSYFLYKLQPSIKSLLIFWIFAPSFLFYGLLNVDLLPIITIILSYYCFTREQKLAAILWLSLGTAIKVFPIFLLPVYLLSASKNQQIKLLIAFVGGWLILNIPFMLSDWGAWSFPYIWQIQSNFARSSEDGSWTWLVFRLFDHFGVGNWSGKVSLLIFAGSYFLILRKYWHLPLARKLMIVIILFLLTDRVYSPQYNLYLLPFLVLVDYKISLKYFYLLELPNFVQGLFLFYMKQHTILLQGIIVFKYLALILLLRQLLISPSQTTTTTQRK